MERSPVSSPLQYAAARENRTLLNLIKEHNEFKQVMGQVKNKKLHCKKLCEQIQFI